MFPVALAGRNAFESPVVMLALFPVALAGREAFESLAVRSCSPSHWPDEMRLSRRCLALFPVASAGRDAFESLVVDVVPRRVGRTRDV